MLTTAEGYMDIKLKCLVCLQSMLDISNVHGINFVRQTPFDSMPVQQRCTCRTAMHWFATAATLNKREMYLLSVAEQKRMTLERCWISGLCGTTES
jgi:hypothetical protein